MKIKIKKIHSEWWAYVWQYRKLMGRLVALGVFVGLIVWLSIPNEYQTDIFTVAEPRVVYVDEYGAVTTNSASADRIRDAILPSNYYRFMTSPTFLLPLTHIPVTLDDDEHTSMTLYDYMAEHQRYPWWQYVVSGVFSIPRLMLAPFRGGDEDTLSARQSLRETLPMDNEGVVWLSRKDARVVKALRRRFDVSVDVDKQSVTLMVRMQDPLVSATVADSLLAHVQRYMTRYRRGCSARPVRIITVPRTNMPAMPIRTKTSLPLPPAPNGQSSACGCNWPSANTAAPIAWCRLHADGWPWSGRCLP